MEKRIKKYHITGTFFILIFGCLLHYIYEWSGYNPLVGVIGAVNESTWEHVKLLFWPSFIYSVIEYSTIGKRYRNYITAKTISLYGSVLLIPTIYYTYTGIIGKHFLMVDILIFVISVAICQYISYKLTIRKIMFNNITTLISLIAILFLVLAFVFFTFDPPKIPLFIDPSTRKYGI